MCGVCVLSFVLLSSQNKKMIRNDEMKRSPVEMKSRRDESRPEYWSRLVSQLRRLDLDILIVPHHKNRSLIHFT